MASHSGHDFGGWATRLVTLYINASLNASHRLYVEVWVSAFAYSLDSSKYVYEAAGAYDEAAADADLSSGCACNGANLTSIVVR